MSIDVKNNNGFNQVTLNITPDSDKETTYNLYWSKNGKRLSGYEPIKTLSHTGADAFEVKLNDGIYMPSEATEMEVEVVTDKKKSYFVSAPDSLKPESSELLYKFCVISDLHVRGDKQDGYDQEWYGSTPTGKSVNTQLKGANVHKAFDDIIAQGYTKDNSFIFTVGDETDSGSPNDYKLLYDIIKSKTNLPDINFTLGNHEYLYLNKNESNAANKINQYNTQLELFKQYHNLAQAPYYSKEINGTKFIVLGSETKYSRGEMTDTQINWLESQLASCEKDELVFLFLHQPLPNTVSSTSGSSSDHGFTNQADKIRDILKNYPNAIMFSGHTHYPSSSPQPALFGMGNDANFVNAYSVGYLYDREAEKVTGTRYVDGAQGLYVEVYKDYVLLRTREYVNGTWCPGAQFKVPIIEK